MIGNGAKVRFHYTLVVDGSVVDESRGREPLSYVHGSGEIVPGLENQLVGLNPGDKRHVIVTPEQGYGERDPGAVQKVPKRMFNQPDELSTGTVVRGQTPNGYFQAVVSAVHTEEVTLDLNHPLAGKTLEFDVEIVEVDPSSIA